MNAEAPSLTVVVPVYNELDNLRPLVERVRAALEAVGTKWEMILVDDAALDVGRVRFRARGSPGGHKGLESVSRALGSEEYARLRIGVGIPPSQVDLSDWVLLPMDPDDEDVVLGLLPELAQGVEVWGEEGIEAAMNRFNR